MEKIQFAVSAKTARLIGRENISGVDGAVIELIKNAYDADATCVFVQFNIPFPAVPQSISFTLATTVLAPTNLPTLLRFYTNNGKCYEKRRDLSIFEEKELNVVDSLLFSALSYEILDEVFLSYTSLTIAELADIYFSMYSEEEKKQLFPNHAFGNVAIGSNRRHKTTS